MGAWLGDRASFEVVQDLARGSHAFLRAALREPWKLTEQCSPATWMLPCCAPSKPLNVVYWPAFQQAYRLFRVGACGAWLLAGEISGCDSVGVPGRPLH